MSIWASFWHSVSINYKKKPRWEKASATFSWSAGMVQQACPLLLLWCQTAALGSAWHVTATVRTVERISHWTIPLHPHSLTHKTNQYPRVNKQDNTVQCVSCWCNGENVALTMQLKGCRFISWLFHFQSTTLGKFFTHVPATKQYKLQTHSRLKAFFPGQPG